LDYVMCVDIGSHVGISMPYYCTIPVFDRWLY
jgi:hypothetical protein